MKKRSVEIGMQLSAAEREFANATRGVRVALSSISDAEREIAAAKQQTALYEGYTAAIYHVSRTPLLDAHPDVRRELVAALEAECESRCGATRQTEDR